MPRLEESHYRLRRTEPPSVTLTEVAGERDLVSADPRVGFEWGYEGGGPLNLARSLLLDRLGEEPLDEMAMAFADEVIASLPRDSVDLPFSRVDRWVAEFRTRPEYVRELERIVLGVLIRDERAQAELADWMLSEEDFSEPRAKAAWTAIAKVMAAERSVTISSVGDEMDPQSGLVDYLDMLRRYHGELYEGNFPKWAARLRDARAWSRRLADENR
jgi:DnaB-like helicase N terminal domain